MSKPPHVPPGSNVPCDGYTYHMLSYINKVVTERGLQSLQLHAPDVTFMIPFGTDSQNRVKNMSWTLTWLLMNTNSKIMIYWSETEDTIKSFDAVFGGIKTGGATNYKEVFKAMSNSCGAGSQPLEGSMLEAGQESIHDFFVSIAIDNFKLPKDNHHFNPYCKAISGTTDPTAFYRPTFVEALKDEITKRVSLFVDYRDDPAFHRMKYINRMLRWADTTYVCNHDTDVLIDKTTLLKTISVLTETDVDFVYPYDHQDTGRRSQYRVYHADSESRELHFLSVFTGDFSKSIAYGETSRSINAWGCTVFARAESYRSAGGEVEQLVSWGPDDVERATRFFKLGYTVARIPYGIVFHLEHPKSENSGGEQQKHFSGNERLWQSIRALDENSLLLFMKERPHVLEYEWDVKRGRVG
mgnify:CR=1 FL=1